MSDSALIIALVIAILVLALSMVMALHALLHKHEPRAAFGWIILCFTVPIIGPIIYVLFGINRPFEIDDGGVNWEFVGTPKGGCMCPVHPLDQISSQLSRYPCSVDNKVSILHNGDEAYPSMLEAIAGAQHFVVMCTYIFDSDEIGKEFVEALAQAKARDIAVYVLIDSVGSLYSFPSAVRLLRRAGIRWRHEYWRSSCI
jgi:cardiolipin synthase